MSDELAVVEDFFAALRRGELAAVIELVADGQEDRVVVEGKNCGTVHATGRTYDHDWVMLFTVRDKRIVRFRHYYDTADLVDALRGD